MEEKKYIICNYARAKWGKTETLLEVIYKLKSFCPSQCSLIIEKPNIGKDKWCLFDVKGKQVVVSTVGDPDSAQPEWLEDAAKNEAKIIVTASRTKGSTVNVVYSVAKRYGYEIIWFQNFHFDNPKLLGLSHMVNARKKEAEAIVQLIDILIINNLNTLL